MARIGPLKLVSEDTYLKYAIGGVLLVQILGFVLLWAFTDPWQYPADTTKPVLTLNWTLLWSFSSVLYTVFSYRFWDPVKSNENGSILVFQRPWTNVGPGPAFAPLFVVQIATVSSKVEQREFPAEPENIFRGEMKSEEGLPKGKKPPVRIPFRNSIKNEQEARDLFGDNFTVVRPEYTDDDGDIHPAREIDFVWSVPKDGLSERLTAEPYPVVRILIDDPSLFVRNIGDLDEAFRQLEDELFAVLNSFYTRMSVAQALANMDWIAAHLHRTADRRVGKRGNTKCWGVDVQAAYVKHIYISKGINTAIMLKAQAPFERDTVIITSEGERKKLINEGQGNAQAAKDLEQQTLAGRGAGYRQVAKDIAATKHGVDVQAAETARALGASGNAILVGADGVKEIISIAKAATIKKEEA